MLINLFGGPGVGKSRTAAGLFSRMKDAGYVVEYVPEFAKRLVSDGRKMPPQEYIFGKQLYYIWQAINTYDHVITDSPLLLSTVYGETSDDFKSVARQWHKKWESLNIMLRRTNTYERVGRFQTEEEARAIDIKIRQELVWIPYHEMPSDHGEIFNAIHSLRLL